MIESERVFIYALIFALFGLYCFSFVTLGFVQDDYKYRINLLSVPINDTNVLYPHTHRYHDGKAIKE